MGLLTLTLCPWLISDVISLRPSDFAMRLMVPSCLEASSKAVRTECFYRHRMGSSKLTPGLRTARQQFERGGAPVALRAIVERSGGRARKARCTNCVV